MGDAHKANFGDNKLQCDVSEKGIGATSVSALADAGLAPLKLASFDDC